MLKGRKWKDRTVSMSSKDLISDSSRATKEGALTEIKSMIEPAWIADLGF